MNETQMESDTGHLNESSPEFEGFEGENFFAPPRKTLPDRRAMNRRDSIRRMQENLSALTQVTRHLETSLRLHQRILEDFLKEEENAATYQTSFAFGSNTANENNIHSESSEKKDDELIKG